MSYAINPSSVRVKLQPVDAVAAWSQTVKSFPTKQLAHDGGVCEDTITAWRAGKCPPRFETAIRLARRVPKIQAAMAELIGLHDKNEYRLIGVLLRALAECTGSADELTATRARKALIEYAEMQRDE